MVQGYSSGMLISTHLSGFDIPLFWLFLQFLSKLKLLNFFWLLKIVNFTLFRVVCWCMKNLSFFCEQKKSINFTRKFFFVKIHNCDPPPKKTQQQKFHTTTFWLLKNLPKKQIIIFGLQSVWVNFNLYYLSFQPFYFWFLFSLIAKKWSRKKPMQTFGKNKSQNEEKIFLFCFLKGVFELLYLNEWDGRVTVTSADIIADNTKTNFMKKQISWNQM